MWVHRPVAVASATLRREGLVGGVGDGMQHAHRMVVTTVADMPSRWLKLSVLRSVIAILYCNGY